MLTVRRDKRKGRKGWRIRGTVTLWKGGRSRSISIDQGTGDCTFAEANAIKRQIEEGASQRTLEGKDRPVTFAEAAIEYLEAGGEARFLEQPIKRLGDYPLEDLTDALILREGRYAYPTRAEATLRRQWWTPVKAVINGHLRGPKPPSQGEKRTLFIRPTDADKIIRYFGAGRWSEDPYGAALVTTLFGCGPRMGEIVQVDGRHDVFMDYGFMMLRDTKNGSERRVTLPWRVKAALSRLPTLGQPGPLYRRFDGKPFAERVGRGGHIRNRFAKAVEEAGLDPKLYTPHVARHSWATWFYSQTKDPLLLKMEGGWKSNEWQRYTHLAEDGLAQEARDCGWEFTGSKRGTVAKPAEGKN